MTIIKHRCACGHPVHRTPCDDGMTIVGKHGNEDGLCGCPKTCPRCLSYGWITVREDCDGEDIKVEVDCPRGCETRAAA